MIINEDDFNKYVKKNHAYIKRLKKYKKQWEFVISTKDYIGLIDKAIEIA